MKSKLPALFIALTILLTACVAKAAFEVTPTPFPTPVRQSLAVQRSDISVEPKLNGRVSSLALYSVFPCT